MTENFSPGKAASTCLMLSCKKPSSCMAEILQSSISIIVFPLCAGGASGAHKLLKIFEKNQGGSYESEHAEMQNKLGSTIADRMASRISTWAVSK